MHPAPALLLTVTVDVLPPVPVPTPDSLQCPSFQVSEWWSHGALPRCPSAFKFHVLGVAVQRAASMRARVHVHDQVHACRCGYVRACACACVRVWICVHATHTSLHGERGEWLVFAARQRGVCLAEIAGVSGKIHHRAHRVPVPSFNMKPFLPAGPAYMAVPFIQGRYNPPAKAAMPSMSVFGYCASSCGVPASKLFVSTVRPCGDGGGGGGGGGYGGGGGWWWCVGWLVVVGFA